MLCESSEKQACRKARLEIERERRVNEALVCFKNAISWIIDATEDIKYLPNNTDESLRHEIEAMGKHLVRSIHACDTHIHLRGDNEACSNDFIYWKAIKINDDRDEGNKTSKTLIKAQDDNNLCSNIAIVREQSVSEKECDGNRSEHSLHPNQELHTKLMFQSMICIYNIALCYQYKGMIAKAKHIRQVAHSQHLYVHPWGLGALRARSKYCLNTAADHYTRAYELMTRFQLEDGAQYTLLMATMNNLAATYGSLNQTNKAEVCNRYLVRSLVLIICSSEREGHLGQEVLSRQNSNSKSRGVLSRREDRTAFESFLSNVTYLMMSNDDERYLGKVIAAAA